MGSGYNAQYALNEFCMHEVIWSDVLVIAIFTTINAAFYK